MQLRSVLVIASILVSSGVTIAGCGSSSRALRRTAANTSRCGKPPLSARPATISISCSGKLVLTHINWGSTWGEPTTRGTGTLTAKDGCGHNCESARTYTHYAVRLVGARITMCPARLRVYSLLTATIINGGAVNGHRTIRIQTVNCGL